MADTTDGAGAAAEGAGASQTPQSPPPAAQAAQAAPQEPSKDFTELFDSVIERKMPQIMRSALKEQGIEDDEAKGIITAYREGKKTQADTGAKQLADLEAQVATLTAEKQQAALSAEVTRIATELDVDPTRITHLSKLADLSAAVKDGTPDGKVVKAALEKVLEDVPEFKKQQTGGIRVGAKSEGAGQGASELDVLLKAAGVKKKE
jgi:hypothetical protein